MPLKAGALTRKYGYGKVLIGAVTLMLTGILITLGSSLCSSSDGMLVLTTGFLPPISVTSSWVGRRARRQNQASSLYLFCYYGGSSIAGTLGGVFWSLLALEWHRLVLLPLCWQPVCLIALYLNKHAHS